MCCLLVVLQDAPFVDNVVLDFPQDGHVEDASDSDSTESDDDDLDTARISTADNQINQSVSIPSKRVKMVARQRMKKTKGPSPESTSQRKRREVEEAEKYYNPSEYLDPTATQARKSKKAKPKFVSKSSTLIQQGIDLINTMFSSATTTTIIPISSVSTPPHTTSTSSQVPRIPKISKLEWSDLNLLWVTLLLQMLHNNYLLRRKELNFLPSKIQINSLTSVTDQILKKLAAQGESSCRQVTLNVLNDDDKDLNETYGEGGVGIRRRGRKQRKRKKVESDVIKEMEGDKLDCLIDLDNVFIEDWESEDENVEIEFKAR
ncbi:hypothetical protein L1987_18896 [Smallanthus sonchifolius]|uniref:Uncharacterized protein n=1 Tax=Smallanthus sonchifolius TaxID=185202 RepID=A0ACB9J0V0_9ASTR|nr:hypothetical protein L1987_18896 [Smallanthus sonchifolius]